MRCDRCGEEFDKLISVPYIPYLRKYHDESSKKLCKSCSILIRQMVIGVIPSTEPLFESKGATA